MSLKPTAEEASGEVYIGGRVDQQRGEAGLVSRRAEYLDIEYTLAGLLQGARGQVVMVVQPGVVQLWKFILQFWTFQKLIISPSKDHCEILK